MNKPHSISNRAFNPRFKTRTPQPSQALLVLFLAIAAEIAFIVAAILF